MSNPALAKLKLAQSNKPVIIKKAVAASSSTQSRPQQRSVILAHKPSTPSNVNGGPKAVNGHAPRSTKPSVASRLASKAPRDSLRHVRSQKKKSASPAVMTPRFDSSDEDDAEDAAERSSKRRRLNRSGSIDSKRRIRDLQAFDEGDGEDFDMVHAANIANSSIIEHNRNKYTTFFTTLDGDEEEEPVIELQYPSASRRERYQVVVPTDETDYRPLAEIKENMKMVAEHYLSPVDGNQIWNEDDRSGLVADLDRAGHFKRRQRIGAQQEFIGVVKRYNDLLDKLRRNGTLAKNVDAMDFIPFPLVEHIVKHQVYARIVSPQVNIVREYEGFSDNVYGELLPKFLSEIFVQTHLKSDQIFVDLGSGVGNCVIQAALEAGCESWGCEMMKNPSKLARLQAKEFSARCRLWGLKPGKVELVEDDFLSNPKVDEVLKRADVVLINNQAFGSDLNNKLTYRFLDMKEGCQIVSLKPFVDPGHKIKETNINDPVNILEVEKRERFSNRVSWTDDPGFWYIHRKSSRRLKEFMETIKS